MNLQSVEICGGPLDGQTLPVPATALEGDHISLNVAGEGGDGLSFYRMTSGKLIYDMEETKKHSKPVSTPTGMERAMELVNTAYAALALAERRSFTTAEATQMVSVMILEISASAGLHTDEILERMREAFKTAPKPISKQTPQNPKA